MNLVSTAITKAYYWKEIILRGAFQTSCLVPTATQILLVSTLPQTRKLSEVLAGSTV